VSNSYLNRYDESAWWTMKQFWVTTGQQAMDLMEYALDKQDIPAAKHWQAVAKYCLAKAGRSERSVA
jgi:hypothetical protein